MTEYGTSTTTHPSPSLPSCVLVQEKKEARKKLLAEVEQRRRMNYKQFYAKMALRRAK